MSSPESSPAETPEPGSLAQPAQPAYCNLGKVRAHLLPFKACRSHTPRSLSSSGPQPPPLPKKNLTRMQSLPSRGVPGAGAAQLRRPLLRSHSVDETQACAGPAAEPTSGDGDTAAALGLPLRGPHSPEALYDALAARELQGLRAVHARLGARLTGGRPGACGAGHGFRLLERTPCAESEDALYYRVVRVGQDAWHLLAAKVPKLGAEVPQGWNLELQASLPPHYNVQGLCGLMPEGALAGAPWTGQVVLAAEVPERTVAQWMAELDVRRPEELVWAVAFTALQLSAALELLEKQGAAVTELCPENLLLVAPRGCAAAGPPRLLLTDFRRVRQRPPGPPGAHAPQLGRLLRTLLGPADVSASPLATGLRRLATQLPRALPSAAQTRGALQALLWGPGPELRGRGTALGPWLRVRRALLLAHLAERAAGGVAPGLEDWLCCEYLAGATEASLGHALELLWTDPK